MFEVNNKNVRMTSLTSFLCFYRHLWTYFASFPSVAIVSFEHVNVNWVGTSFLPRVALFGANHLLDSIITINAQNFQHNNSLTIKTKKDKKVVGIASD